MPPLVVAGIVASCGTAQEPQELIPDIVESVDSPTPGDCLPCIQDSDCSSRWGFSATCLSFGKDGAFCSRPCDEESSGTGYNCPSGQRCQVTKGTGDEVLFWCIPEDPAAPCQCDMGAVFETRWTTCERANSWGICEGARYCTTDGMSECDATTPGEEVCNGQDDDCDDKIDEGFKDFDADGVADCIDADDDSDQVDDTEDNCPFKKNPEQKDLDGDGVGDECDTDADGDTVPDDEDCQPLNPEIHPGVPEICDGLDNDCNGQVDESSCDDGDPCTAGLCNGDLECEYAYTTSPCNDNDLCTAKDRCDEGTCIGKNPMDCNDDDPCTIDFCEPWGGCKHQPHAEQCDDGDPCTLPGACVDGACTVGSPVECDDGDQCTLDYCDSAVAQGCVNVAHTDACDDGNACTAADVCYAGDCNGVTIDCDDDNACTLEFCDNPVGCVTLVLAAVACDDGSECTLLDACSGEGVCEGLLELDCDDANACTEDACDPEVGCINESPEEACDDGDACTVDWCDPLTGCQTDLLTCDDENPCTADLCDPDEGCQNPTNNDACEDGDLCTGPDQCVAGECVGGPIDTCDDGNDCTTDICQPAAGCFNLFNSNPCTDGNKCTKNDACSDGACKPGPPLSCYDGNQCTINTCDPLSGCKVTFDDGPCNDMNGCTVNDTCNGAGACIGDPKVCDDGNACTVNHCDQPYDCVFLGVSKLPCNDGNACTTGDLCNKFGQCVGGALTDCNDDDPCTLDLCATFFGCIHNPINGCQ